MLALLELCTGLRRKVKKIKVLIIYSKLRDKPLKINDINKNHTYDKRVYNFSNKNKIKY